MNFFEKIMAHLLFYITDRLFWVVSKRKKEKETTRTKTRKLNDFPLEGTSASNYM